MYIYLDSSCQGLRHPWLARESLLPSIVSFIIIVASRGFCHLAVEAMGLKCPFGWSPGFHFGTLGEHFANLEAPSGHFGCHWGTPWGNARYWELSRAKN